MCVSPPSPPSDPTPQPPPPIIERPRVAPPDSEDDSGEAAQDRRRARVQARGRRGTMLTGSQGVTENPNLGIRTLLGQEKKNAKRKGKLWNETWKTTKKA